MTHMDNPVYLSKSDIEGLVKKHGGSVFQSETARKKMTVIAEKGIAQLPFD